MEVGEREEEEVKPLLFHRALSLRPANVCIRFVSYLSYRKKSYFPVKNGERGGRVNSTNSRSPNHRHTVNTSCVYSFLPMLFSYFLTRRYLENSRISFLPCVRSVGGVFELMKTLSRARRRRRRVETVGL